MARGAVAIFEEIGDKASYAGALHDLASGLLFSDNIEEAQRMARKCVTTYQAIGGGAKLNSALLISAKASLKKGSFIAAYWDAKQAMSDSADDTLYAEALTIMQEAQRMGDDLGKPINAGAPVRLSEG